MMSGMASKEAMLSAFSNFFNADKQTYLIRIQPSRERYSISVMSIEADTAIEAYIKALDKYTPDQIVGVKTKDHD
jgi:hypothetical protein